ncbi:hypothetical protein ABFS82_14G235600 [Erythranthe guttata]|uniref:putative phytosulfokines 6 n=1 Tax=Erythranthe guttata TaxID=4155 RepID=UPI00064DD330|nr:PREDICTED: putative phytosulfokines 6 [Erythranthe guttata]|eukprot:XP_012838318.1 PREDICTED: putative phytosulfokines 6 [Erythranthe guttata]
MKNPNFNSLAIILLLAFFITTSNSTARKLASEQGEVDENMTHIKRKDSVVEIGKIDSFDMEEYQNDEDEDDLKRRVTAEAHLDYIYTQHLQP